MAISQRLGQLGQLAGITLVLVLSYQLFSVKRELAHAEMDIERSTTAFVGGMPLPPVPVRLANGLAGSLTDYCGLRRPLVVVISSRRCAKCMSLAKRWVPLARERADLQFIAIGVDGVLPVGDEMATQVVAMHSTPTAVSGLLHVRHLPVVIRTDSTCRVTAAGTGLSATLAIIGALDIPSP